MSSVLQQGAEYVARGAALPYLLGLRWMQRRARPGSGLLLSGKIAIDELFYATEVLLGAPFSLLEAERIGTEARDAAHLFGARGWLDDPARYHATPPPLEAPDLTAAAVAGMPYLHLRFASGYAPAVDEPGRVRWLGYGPNHTAHCWLHRHPGPQRPWLVCLPGYRMGHPAVDLVGFRVRHLHHALGLNVAIPVLPFHGPRTVGRRGGDGFLSGDFLDTIHAQAQAVWDARRLIRWLRREGAPAIGLYGLSLGGYTTALLAALEDELDCVIAGIPAIDFLELMIANTSPLLVRMAERLGFRLDDVRRALTVVSPLAMPLRVPARRCYVFAGTGDTLAPARQALDLWRHWRCPRLDWYEGGHVSFVFERAVREIVTDALRATGLAAVS